MNQLTLLLLSILLISCGGGEYPKQFNFSEFRIMESSHYIFDSDEGLVDAQLEQILSDVENQKILDTLNTFWIEGTGNEDGDINSFQIRLDSETEFSIQFEDMKQSGQYEIIDGTLLINGEDGSILIDDNQEEILLQFYMVLSPPNGFSILNTLDGLSLSEVATMYSEDDFFNAFSNEGDLINIAIVDMVLN